MHKLIRLKSLLPFEIENLEDSILTTLDELYIESRYPSEMGLLPYGKPTLEDAKEFYNFANNLFIEVCELLHVNKSKLK